MNSEFKIEKGIPAPRYSKGRGLKYPFDKMEVGDSFLATGSKPHVVSSCASNFGKKNSKKFVTRIVDGGVRVWRAQ